jgi:hypothetical protein
MWMSPEDIEANVKTLALVNIKSSLKYFTTEILEEVFKGASHV